ncbi:DUF4365 domain-containing protein [Actinoplanes sp. CA-054009]
MLLDQGIRSFRWDQTEDKGVDLVAFVVEGGQATGFVMGIQVKSGASFTRADHEGRIPIRKHRHYWTASTLPIFVVTVDAEENVLIEDAYSAIIARPEEGLVGGQIRCRVGASLAGPHLRMRARVQALAPSLSAALRDDLLAQVVHGSAFAAVRDAYRRLGDPLEIRYINELANVVRWMKRDPSEERDLREYCGIAESFALIALPIMDACAQWAVAKAAEVASMQNFPLDHAEVVRAAKNELELPYYLLTSLFEAASLESGKSHSQIIEDVLRYHDLPAEPMPDGRCYLAHLALTLIRDAIAPDWKGAIEEAQRHLLEEGVRYLSDLQGAMGRGEIAQGEYIGSITMLLSRLNS